MRAPAALAAVLLALVAPGCGDDDKIVAGGEIVGKTLTVYSLMPRDGARADVARSAILGQKLALAQAGGQAGAFNVNFAAIDVTQARGDDARERVANAVRDALDDQQIVAAIADVGTATARVTVPMLNAAGVLHLSPGATYTGLVAPVPDDVEPAAPGRYHPARRDTFAPVLPTDAAQAVAIARLVEGPVEVEAEAGEASRALAAAVLDRVGATVPSARARTFVYAGEDPDAALGVVDAVVRENPRARIILPHALWLTDLPERLPERLARRVTFVTAAGPPSGEPAFAAAYRERFGEAPGRLSLVGHQAMRDVLAAIERAGPRARLRREVAAAHFATDPLADAASRPFWRVVMRGGEPRYLGPIRP